MTDVSNFRPPEIDARGLACAAETRPLLNNVDLRADKGQFVGLIGPNGAGKSTLLRTLARILQRTEGTVRLGGRDLDALSAREVAAFLALVPQAAPYTQGFHAFELVLMGRYPHLGPFAVEGAADTSAAMAAMSQTETDAFVDRTLETLSGGERQRVFLARAVAQHSRVLLLDEPTANLDILHQLKILGLVRRLVNEGLTAVAAIHDLNLAARYCDRLVVLSRGRVLAEGEPSAVLLPEVLAAAFGIRARVYSDPVTRSPVVSPIGPVGEKPDNAQFPEGEAHVE